MWTDPRSTAERDRAEVNAQETVVDLTAGLWPSPEDRCSDRPLNADRNQKEFHDAREPFHFVVPLQPPMTVKPLLDLTRFEPMCVRPEGEPAQDLHGQYMVLGQ